MYIFSELQTSKLGYIQFSLNAFYKFTMDYGCIWMDVPVWSEIHIYCVKCLFNSAQNHSNTHHSVITTSRNFPGTLKRSIYLTSSQFSTPFWLPHQPFSQRQNWTARNVRAVKWTCPIYNLQSTSLKEAFSYEFFCEEKKKVKLFPKNEELMYSEHSVFCSHICSAGFILVRWRLLPAMTVEGPSLMWGRGMH